MEKKMKKTRRGAIVFEACLIAGVAFCVSAEPLKEKDSSISLSNPYTSLPVFHFA